MDGIAGSSNVTYETRYLLLQQEQANKSAMGLVNFLAMLHKQFKLIAMITVACALIGVIIAYKMPVQYKTTVRLMPPGVQDYKQLVLNADMHTKSVDLFQLFLDRLSSKGNLKDFLFDHMIKKGSSRNDHLVIDRVNELAQNCFVTKVNQVSPQGNYINTNGSNLIWIQNQPDLNAADVVAYLNYTTNHLLDNLKKNQIAANEIKMNHLKAKINHFIAQQSIGELVKFATLENNTPLVRQPSKNVVLLDDIEDTTALSNELKDKRLERAYKLAVNRDQYAGQIGLRQFDRLLGVKESQAELARLEKLSFDLDQVHFYLMDGQPDFGTNPFKPNRSFIITLGTIAGIILGLFSALIKHNIGLALKK